MTFDGWIDHMDGLPDAPFHYEDMIKYLMKMFIFKCMDLKMEMEEITEVCKINDRKYKSFVTKYHGYNKGNDIIYPYFIFYVKDISEICGVIEKFILNKNKYEDRGCR